MEEIDIICLEKRIIKIISKIYREVKKSQFGGK